MAKRFTDSNKYKKSFFRALQAPYKIFWDFLYHDCDHAGIWIVDFEAAQIYVGKDAKITREEALRLFNQEELRIIEIDGGRKWFLPSFVEFQYGHLSEKNRAHINVISVLKKQGLLSDDLQIVVEAPSKVLTRTLQGPKEKEQEQEKEQELEQEKEKTREEFLFETARSIYPGKKRGLLTEFENFKKKHKDWRSIIEMLRPAVMAQMDHREYLRESKAKFIPEWPHFKTWIEQRRWEEELPEIEINQPTGNDRQSLENYSQKLDRIKQARG